MSQCPSIGLSTLPAKPLALLTAKRDKAAPCVFCATQLMHPARPYINIKGRDRFLYRTVDSAGPTINFLLTDRHDAAAAKRFFRRALRNDNSMPGVINREVRRLNVEEAVRLAISQNRSLKIARLKIDDNQQRKAGDSSSYFPSITNQSNILHFHRT